MPVRTANAEWKGDLRGGQGFMKLGSNDYGYSFSSRFEEGAGSNPEELIAAAHAGCFSMAFANGLAGAGFTPNRVQTTARVYLERLEAGGFGITRIELNTEGEVPGIDEAKFKELAETAKQNCPVSKALAAVPNIRVNARLL
jgi:osmotically inducible protein OsmC